jgi:hypothetical protein
MTIIERRDESYPSCILLGMAKLVQLAANTEASGFFSTIVPL